MSTMLPELDVPTNVPESLFTAVGSEVRVKRERSGRLCADATAGTSFNRDGEKSRHITTVQQKARRLCRLSGSANGWFWNARMRQRLRPDRKKNFFKADLTHI